MADAPTSQNQREFRCCHCDGLIRIPHELPPTTGPCPHCSDIITSPALEASEPEVSPPIPAQHVEEDVRTDAQAAGPEAIAPRASTTASATKSRRCGLITFLVVVIGMILLGVTYVIVRQLGKNSTPQSSTAPLGAHSSVSDANYIRIGWQKDATRILEAYMAATTAKEKIPSILNGEALAPKIEAFYDGNAINDSDIPADEFSAFELPEKDRQRGLFMMIYDSPPQIDAKGSLTQDNIRPSNAVQAATESVRVLAFFKRTNNGLKLDWETFAQTKYRTLLTFIEQPKADHSGVFRVIVMADVPENGHAVHGTHPYRIVDPANISDSARVNVKIDSEAGRILSALDRRDPGESEPITRTATVELRWTGGPEAPELVLHRFICWEFLGLGGEQTSTTATK